MGTLNREAVRFTTLQAEVTSELIKRPSVKMVIPAAIFPPPVSVTCGKNGRTAIPQISGEAESWTHPQVMFCYGGKKKKTCCKEETGELGSLCRSVN